MVEVEHWHFIYENLQEDSCLPEVWTNPNKVRGIMTTTETTNAIIKYLTVLGCYVWRQNTVGIAGRRIAKSSRGVGDIIGLTRDGRHIEVEIKTGADKLRDEQIIHGEAVQRRNGLYFVAKTFDDFEKQWLNEKGAK